MDLIETAAYHGSSYSHRGTPAGGDYQGTLGTAFLCTIAGESDGESDEYQFLETPDVEAFNEEVRAYCDMLEEHGTETVVAESRYPNATYTADVYLGFDGDLYLSRMASDVRRREEPERFAFAHEHGYDPIVPFRVGEYFEISNAIPSNDGLVLGVGQRGTERAARRLASHVDAETTIVKIDDNVQHLMGALRPLSDGRAAIRPAQIEDHERLERCYDNLLEFDDPFEEPEDGEEVALEVRTATQSSEETIREINDELDVKFDPSHIFIGRWQPLHDGHQTIIDSAADNSKDVVIAIRDTELSEKNPLTAQERQELIGEVYEDHPNVETMIIPDVDTVAIGRDVGYSVVSVPEEVAQISGTDTRAEYEKSKLLEGEHFAD